MRSGGLDFGIKFNIEWLLTYREWTIPYYNTIMDVLCGFDTSHIRKLESILHDNYNIVICRMDRHC